MIKSNKFFHNLAKNAIKMKNVMKTIKTYTMSNAPKVSSVPDIKA